MTISKITTIAELDNGPVADESMVLQRIDNIDTYATGKQIKEYIAAASQADFEREVNTRQTTDADLFQKINAETTNRTNADSALQNQITSLDTRQTASEQAITTLNGEGNGSVKKTVADAIAEVVNGADASFDTLKEISDWIGNHTTDAASMNSAIQTNTANIAQEISDRQLDTVTLTNSLSVETTARTNKDTQLQNDVDLINSKWSSVFGDDTDTEKKNPIVKELAVSTEYLQNGNINNILTATYSDNNTRDFTIYGNKGDRGSQWFYGTALTGTSTTPTVFAESGIELAIVGDVYRNTDTQETYQCVKSGSANNAQWVYTGSLKYPVTEVDGVYWVEAKRVYDRNLNLLSKIYVKMLDGYRKIYAFTDGNGDTVFASTPDDTNTVFYTDIDLTHLTVAEDVDFTSRKTYYAGTVIVSDKPSFAAEDASILNNDTRILVSNDNNEYAVKTDDFATFTYFDFYKKLVGVNNQIKELAQKISEQRLLIVCKDGETPECWNKDVTNNSNLFDLADSINTLGERLNYVLVGQTETYTPIDTSDLYGNVFDSLAEMKAKISQISEATETFPHFVAVTGD